MGAGEDGIAELDRRINVPPATFLGYAPHGEVLGRWPFWLVLGTCAIAAVLVSAYFRSVAGALAVPIRDKVA